MVDSSVTMVDDGCRIKLFPNFCDPHEDQAGCGLAQEVGSVKLLFFGSPHTE